MAAPIASAQPVLDVEGLVKHYPIAHSRAFVAAVNGVSFQIRRGETLGLVGESGCGKTTVGRLILRLIEPTTGRIVFDGQDITKVAGSALKPYRRRMQIIFQDPFASLNPRMTVEEIVDELPERSLNAVVLPTWTIGHVVEVPGGAFPSYAQGYYPRNNGFYKEWDEISRERESFLSWIKENVLAKGPEDFARYARKHRAAAE